MLRTETQLSIPLNANVASGLLVESGQRNLCADPRCTTAWEAGTSTPTGWNIYNDGTAVGSGAKVAGGGVGGDDAYDLTTTAGTGTPFFKQERYGVAAGKAVYWSAYVATADLAKVTKVAAFGAYTTTPTVLGTSGSFTRIGFLGTSNGGTGCGCYVSPGQTVRISRVMFGVGTAIPSYSDGLTGDAAWDVVQAPVVTGAESYNDASGTLVAGDYWWVCVESRDAEAKHSDQSEWVEVLIGGGHNAIRIFALPDAAARATWKSAVRVWGVKDTGLHIPPDPGSTAYRRDSYDPGTAGSPHYFRSPLTTPYSTGVPAAADASATALHTSTKPALPVSHANTNVVLDSDFWLGLVYKDAVASAYAKTLYEMYNATTDKLHLQVRDDEIGLSLSDGTLTAGIGCHWPSDSDPGNSKAVTLGYLMTDHGARPSWLTATQFDALYAAGYPWYKGETNDDGSQTLNWAQAQVMSSLIWAYEAWGDTKYLDWFVELADDALSVRDDARGVKMFSEAELIAGHYNPASYGTSYKTWRIADYQTAMWFYGRTAGGTVTVSLKLVNGQPDARTVQIVNHTTTFDVVTQTPDGNAITFAGLTVDSTSPNYFVKRINNSAPPGSPTPTEWNSSGNGLVAYDPLAGAGVPATHTPVARPAAGGDVYHYHVDQVIGGPNTSMARFCWLVSRDNLTAYEAKATTYNQAVRDHLAYEATTRGEYQTSGDTGWFIMARGGGRGFADGVDAGIGRQTTHALMYLHVALGYGGGSGATRAANHAKAKAILNYIVDHTYADEMTGGLRWYYADGPYASGWGYGGSRPSNDEAVPGDPSSRPFSCSTFWWFGNSTGYFQWDDFSGHADGVIQDLGICFRTAEGDASYLGRLTGDVLRRITVNLLGNCYRRNPTSGREECYKTIGPAPWSAGDTKWTDYPAGDWSAGLSCCSLLYPYSTDVLDIAASSVKERMDHHGGDNVTLLDHFAMLAWAHAAAPRVPQRSLQIVAADAVRQTARSVIDNGVTPGTWGTAYFAGSGTDGQQAPGRIAYLVIQPSGAAALQAAAYRAAPPTYFAGSGWATAAVWFPFTSDGVGYWGFDYDSDTYGFSDDNLSVRVGETDFAEIGARVTALKLLRGEQGPADMSGTLMLDGDAFLPTPITLARGDRVEVFDGLVSIWDGYLDTPHLNPDATITLSAKGGLAFIKDNPTYQMVWVLSDYSLWSSDQVDNDSTAYDNDNDSFSVDTDNRLRIRLEAADKIVQPPGADKHQCKRIYFALPQWATSDWFVKRVMATFAVTNPKLDESTDFPLKATLSTKNVPQGAVTATLWHVDPADGNESGSINEPLGTPKPVLMLKYTLTGADGTYTTYVARQVLLTSVKVFCRRDDTVGVRIDQALEDMFTDSGLADSIVIPAPVGDKIDNVTLLEPTTIPDGMATLAEMHSGPVRTHLEQRVATIEERETQPSDTTRYYVAAIAPGSGRVAACPGYSIDEGSTDYVVVTYSCKNDPDYVDGTRLRVVYPAGTPAPTDRVTAVDYPSDVNVSESRAMAYATRLYGLTKATAVAGSIPLANTFITTVDGVPVPAWHVKENSWVRILDAPAHEAAMPFYITGVEYERGVGVTLYVGNAELRFSPKHRNRKRRHPRPLRLPKGYWKDAEHRKGHKTGEFKPRKKKRGDG